MRFTAPPIWAFIFAVAVARPFAAWGDAPIINDAPRPHFTIPHAPQPPPLVTAQADDPAWSRVPVLLVDTPSLSSSPPPQRPIPKTEVRAMWDPDWLYVRFVCADDHAPYALPRAASGSLSNGDVVEMFLDPIGDCRQWYEFQFNPAGEWFTQTAVCTGDPKWDASLHFTRDFISRGTWYFQDPAMQTVRHAAAAWQEKGQTRGWIVDVALPAAPILKRTGLKKFQAMTLRGDFLRYEYLPVAGSDKRDFLALNWSPVVLGGPHRSPAAYGYFVLSPSSP